MKIDVITLFPEMIQQGASYGVLGQALTQNKLSVMAHTPREFATDRHKTVDDRPFGGGDGMVMMAEPLEKTILKVKHNNSKIIYLSPQGRPFSAQKAQELSREEHLIFICGRYGGIDQRAINTHVQEELSIGDYVLSGGELAALVVIDSLARFIPGVLGHADSAQEDSFSQGLLEHPAFTKPRSHGEQDVPKILLSGDHGSINEWKRNVALLVTLKKRPDLLIEWKKQHQQALAEASGRSKKRPSLWMKLIDFYRAMPVKEKKVLALEDLNLEELIGKEDV
ncbi:MAG: tRNA (guanosine(37)-N1)-methyltransferase TrmD [Bdellovibrio sp.]